MEKLIIVYITNPSQEKAEEIVQLLLNKKLIACATLVPCKSVYWWQGDLCNDSEVIICAKTVERHADSIDQEVIRVHPYQTPCIIKIPIDANIAYKEWVIRETNKI